MRSRVTVLVFLAAMLVSTAFAVPPRVAQQGRMLDGDGDPLTGSHELVFTLYDDVTAGSPVWSETHQLDFEEGYYWVTLGETNALDDLLFDSGALWLQLTVDGADLAPRQEIVSVPYAVRAGGATHVDGGIVDASEVYVAGVPVIDGNGNWVGPTTPVSWNHLTDRPSDLVDGDADNQLTETQVEGFVTDESIDLAVGSTVDGAAISTGAHTTALPWSAITGIPSDIDDGDADNQLTETQVEDYITNGALALSGDLTVDTSTLFVDSANHRVGIATTSPEMPLHVLGADGLTAKFEDATGKSVLVDGNAVEASAELYLIAGTMLYFKVGSSFPMFANATSVGIGTTSPSETLSVAGTVESTSGGFKFPDGTTQTSAAPTGGPGTVIYTRCAWSGANAETIGSCVPPSCPSGWTDLETIGNIKNDGSAGGNVANNDTLTESAGASERGCFLASPLAVFTVRCAWSGANAETIGSCVPGGCPSGWTDWGVTGNVKMSGSAGGNVANNDTLTESSGYQERTCTL